MFIEFRTDKKTGTPSRSAMFRKQIPGRKAGRPVQIQNSGHNEHGTPKGVRNLRSSENYKHPTPTE